MCLRVHICSVLLKYAYVCMHVCTRMCNFANPIANRIDVPQRAIVYCSGRVRERACEPSERTHVRA